jgi:Flp pilus assembly protein TadG
MAIQKVQRKKRERGSALVESALVLLVFVVVLVGVMDFGQFLFVHQTLVETCRKAARYGVVNPYNEEQIRNIVLYDAPQAPANGQARFGLEASMVNVTRLDAGTNEDRVQVAITNYPFEFFTPFIARSVRGLPITTVMSYEVQ